MSVWNDSELINLFLQKTPLIDVRAPVEFESGSLPGAINLPIMNDEERALVGTCYKQQGQAAAIELGHSLVSGKIKEERIQSWCEAIRKNPATQVFCFRGGLRSQLACQWIEQAGISRTPIPGGYKRMRGFFLARLEEAPLPKMIRLSGYTGSGKTEVLKYLPQSIDLESLANHRGSAFGDLGPQPSQSDFENSLALELIKKGSPIVVEDESAVIGRLSIPKRFFLHMRESPIILLKTNEENRIQHIFEEYVLKTPDEQLRNSLLRIQRSLGGLRYKEVAQEMEKALKCDRVMEQHHAWIALLLKYYYDPLYQRGLARQQDHIKFEGTASEVLQFISSNLAFK
jgi:tRNA 2-selenouridine synthase